MAVVLLPTLVLAAVVRQEILEVRLAVMVVLEALASSSFATLLTARLLLLQQATLR
jgi:hypothetical protein